MEIEINKEKVTIKTEQIVAVCMTCGKLIGSCEAIKGTVSTSLHSMYPVCSDCFKRLNLKQVPPNFDARIIFKT